MTSNDEALTTDVARDDLRNYCTGLVDAGLDVTVRASKLDPEAKTFRVVVRLPSEELLKIVRSQWASSSATVSVSKSGVQRAWAEFTGDSARSLLRSVAKRGVANRTVAHAAYSFLKQEMTMEEAVREIEAARTREVKTRVVERIVKPKKKKGEEADPPERVVEDIVPEDGEVDAVADLMTPGWIGGFLDALATVRPARTTNTKRQGRIVVETRKLPGALAIAGGILKHVRAGKLNAARPRLTFSTKRDVDALSKGAAEARFVDFAALA